MREATCRYRSGGLTSREIALNSPSASLEPKNTASYLTGIAGIECRAPVAERQIALPLEQERKVATQASPHTTEYSLTRAAECDQKAEEAIDPKNRAIFLDLAIRWRNLALESKDGASLASIGQARPSTSPG
jgi:hypothetical protein